MFDVAQLRLQIEGLLRDYPALAEDEGLRADMIDGETNLNDALALLVKEIKISEYMVDGITKERVQLLERRNRHEHRIDVLRELILEVLQSADLKRVQLPAVTLTQVSGQPQIIGELDADALPDDLVRIRREADRTAIKQALLDHRVLPGLSLSNAAPFLMIRRK
jgi:hypothetical protein